MTFSTFSPPVYRGRVISPILSIWQKQEVAARPAVYLDFIARKRVYHKKIIYLTEFSTQFIKGFLPRPTNN